MITALRSLKLSINHWLSLKDNPSASTLKSRLSHHRALILPAAAPGGVGDDAMVNGAIACLDKYLSHNDIGVLVPKHVDGQFRFHSNVESIRLYSDWGRIEKILLGISQYDRFYNLGADILDGHYSYADAVRRIKLSSLASDWGIKSSIVGFSINSNPHPAVIDAFNNCNGRVSLHFRDPLSFERAKKIIKGDIRLSADAAFMLRPATSEVTRAVADFCSSARSRGNFVFGVNIHSLLGKSDPENELLPKLASSIANLIEESANDSFVFIPHDFRSFVDDRQELLKIWRQLSASAQERVYRLDTPVRAGEIKQITSYLDGILTGRMHLAIAALGMSTPVLGIVYQGKFEGTFSHFKLDQNCLINPVAASDRFQLSRQFNSWKSNLFENKQRINANIDSVLSLSQSNFES